MSIYNELQNKSNDIHALAKKYGAMNLRLFGSVARQEEHKNSDIDILAEFEDGRSLFDLIGLKQDIESLLHRQVDILTPGSLHWLIKDKILKESIKIEELGDG